MMAITEPRGARLGNDEAWLLLAELNHRVRNELQVALSALRLTKRQLSSADPARFIEEAELRLEGLGHASRVLDRQLGHGPLAQRLEALCRATSHSRGEPLGVRLVLELDEVTTDEETAWAVCVVASELMTNAFKHAFRDGAPGMVRVVLRQSGGRVLLTVSDNGAGDAGPGRGARTVWQPPGLGTGIVDQLAERLGGFVTRASGPAGVTVIFGIQTGAGRQ
jgi:two-component sensor histidine kinase